MARPKSRLRKFKDDNGLSDEGLAALLSERTGEEIDAERVAVQISRSGNKIPRDWEEALGFEPWQRTDTPAYRAGDDTAPEPGEGNPKQKPPAPPVDELDWRNAEEAIAAIYISIGQGVSMIRKRPEIATMFQQAAPILARDWVALAKVDARTRGVIAKIMVIGPGGALAMDHLILVGKLISLEKPHVLPPTPADFLGYDGQAPQPPPQREGAANGAGAPGPVAPAGSAPQS